MFVYLFFITFLDSESVCERGHDNAAGTSWSEDTLCSPTKPSWDVFFLQLCVNTRCPPHKAAVNRRRAPGPATRREQVRGRLDKSGHAEEPGTNERLSKAGRRSCHHISPGSL